MTTVTRGSLSLAVAVAYCVVEGSCMMIRERREAAQAHPEPIQRLDELDILEDPADAVEFMGTASNSTRARECTKFQLPSVLYIGLPHAGSTSLAGQLNMHPELSYGLMKEHRHFTALADKSVCHVSPLYHQRNFLVPYKSGFDVDCRVRHAFDASPTTMYIGNPKAKPHLHAFHAPGRQAVHAIKRELGPETKLIVMLRDPVDYLNSQCHSTANLTMGEKILHGSNDWRTCYADSLDSWMAVFPRENFLFLMSEDYFLDPQGVLDRIFRFLHVDTHRYSDSDLHATGRRRNSRAVEPSVRKEFHAKRRNQECKKRLESLTGIRFDWKDEQNTEHR